MTNDAPLLKTHTSCLHAYAEACVLARMEDRGRCVTLYVLATVHAVQIINLSLYKQMRRDDETCLHHHHQEERACFDC